MDRQTVRIIISGQVQGVFFRRTAKEEADKLGLVGWVRNNRDWSVETLAVGPKDKLEKFLEWCKKGSPSAKVLNVEVDWQNTEEDFDSFEILD